ncbi:YcxB family protein [Hirschia litorea]|uniref:YcxB family protein n=1 Tax=Hirschia litorea TaxID=1199156 RepID=A0ABW2IMU4_9PROT
MIETPYRPEEATGDELSYRDSVTKAGHITPRQLKRFIKARRNGGFGPTTLYYAGVVAPVISAATLQLFETFFSEYNISPLWADLLSMIFAASAGLSWFLIFTRLAERQKDGRDDETTQSFDFNIDRKRILIKRKHITTQLDWAAIVDIRTTKHYIAFIVEGANDFFIPVDWFDNQKQMMEAARKVAALRPPPLKVR